MKLTVMQMKKLKKHPSSKKVDVMVVARCYARRISSFPGNYNQYGNQCKPQELYIPDKHVSVDECTTGYKGKIQFKVYNKDKPTK